MAEMEKEGRPPENKRSRKPAHPVKREINEEMKVKKKKKGGGVYPAACHCAWKQSGCGARACLWNQASSVKIYHSGTAGCMIVKLWFVIFFFPLSSIVIHAECQPQQRTLPVPPRTMDAAPIRCCCSTTKFWINKDAFLSPPVIISPFVCPAFCGLPRVHGKSSASVKASTVPLLLLILLHYGATESGQCA